MAKTITIKYEGAEYTLEYTRDTVSIMEKSGFNISDIGDKPVSTLPKLFNGAFLAHHRNLKAGMTAKIFEALPDKMGLLEKLAEMYSEPVETLLDDPEDDAGNASWGADF